MKFPNLLLIRLILAAVFSLGLIGCAASKPPSGLVYDVEQLFDVIRASNRIANFNVAFDNAGETAANANAEPVILISATNTVDQPLSLTVNLHQEEGVFTSEPEVIQVVALNAISPHQEIVKIMAKSGSANPVPYTVKVIISGAPVKDWLTDATLSTYITADLADFDEDQNARLLLGSDSSLSVIGLTNAYNGADASLSITVPDGFVVSPNRIDLPDPDGVGIEANTITPSKASFSITETANPANYKSYTLNPIDLLLNDYTQKLATHIGISNPPDAFNSISIDRTDADAAPVIVLRVAELNTVDQPLSLTVNINQEQGVLTTTPESLSITAPTAISPHQETIEIMAAFGSTQAASYTVRVIINGAQVNDWLTSAGVADYITASLFSQPASLLLADDMLSLTGITNQLNGNEGSIEFTLPRGFIADPGSVRLVDPDGEEANALAVVLSEATFTISEFADPTNLKTYFVTLILEAYVSPLQGPNISATFDTYTTTEDDIEVIGDVIIISGFTNIPTDSTTGTITINPPDGYSISSGDETITFVNPPGTNAQDLLVAAGVSITGSSSDSLSVRHNVIIRFSELVLFDPENRDHIGVYINGSNEPIEQATFSLIPPEEDGARPVIVLSGLINSGFSASDPSLARNKWVVAVTANTAFTATSGGFKYIHDPPGYAATEEIPYGIITVRNLKGSVSTDDEYVSYDLRVIFSEGIGIGSIITLKFTGDDFRGGSATASYVADENIIALTTAPCSALGEVTTSIVDDNDDIIPGYSVGGILMKYYNRHRGSTVSDNGLQVTNTQTLQIQMENAEGSVPVVGNFRFSFVYPACLAEHLGSRKTGLGIYSAYEIGKAEHLEAVAYLVNQSNDIYGDKFYRVIRSFDLAGEIGHPWSRATPGSSGFTPIGRSNQNAISSFSGTFDCEDKIISNLYMLSGSYVGLIGIASNAAIKNCALRDVYILGTRAVGSLVGHSESSTVTDSYSTGTVLGSTNVGGLVGVNVKNSTIDNCYSTAVVSNLSRTGSLNAGGLVGHNSDSSKVKTVFASGSVTGSYRVGGLVGYNSGGSRVEDAHATGDVRGNNSSHITNYNTGGLVGHNRAWVTNSYATGNVWAANSSVGGLVGYNEVGGRIDNSYASGTVTGGAYVGGLVGRHHNAHIIASYASGAVTGNNNVGGLIGFDTHEGNTVDAYATGNVVGNSNVGGLIGTRGFGHVDRSANGLTNSYSIGDVLGNYNVGLFIGKNIYYGELHDSPNIDGSRIAYEGVYRNSYFNSDSTRIVGSDAAEAKGVGSDDASYTGYPPRVTSHVIGLSQSQLQSLRSTSWRRYPYFWWNRSSAWLYEAGHYPRLKRVRCANHQYANGLPDTCENLE